MRDPEQVARAQHAAARLEAAWERWRKAQGMAETPAQPVVGYVGYALREPWGQPRAVIGFSADEAERLAEHLESGAATMLSQPVRSSGPKTAPTAVQQWSGSPAGRPAAEPQSAEPTATAPREPASRQADEKNPAAEPEAKLTADRSLLLTRF